jgi:ABC-type dipeptide/oligopeptide/nickel transport system permease component
VLAFIVRRLLLAIPTLVGVLVVVFLLLFVAPGDPVQEMVGERADPETIARLRRELRLDEPLYNQFLSYVAGCAWSREAGGLACTRDPVTGRREGVLFGDLGRSYITNRPIVRDIAERFPKTLLLAVSAMAFASLVGITLGVLSARFSGGWVDRLSLGFAYLGISFPVYWVGLLLILVFAVMLQWLPPSGYGSLAHLILPALALGSRSIAFLARVTRSAMLEILGSDFVRTARAKGLRDRSVITRHALRNALIPIITVLGLDFGSYLTGSILTETIFSWPGIGRYVVNAIGRRDLPAIQGSILFLSVVFVTVNLLTDLAYAKADPRIAYK